MAAHQLRAACRLRSCSAGPGGCRAGRRPKARSRVRCSISRPSRGPGGSLSRACSWPPSRGERGCSKTSAGSRQRCSDRSLSTGSSRSARAGKSASSSRCRSNRSASARCSRAPLGSVPGAQDRVALAGPLLGGWLGSAWRLAFRRCRQCRRRSQRCCSRRLPCRRRTAAPSRQAARRARGSAQLVSAVVSPCARASRRQRVASSGQASGPSPPQICSSPSWIARISPVSPASASASRSSSASTRSPATAASCW